MKNPQRPLNFPKIRPQLVKKTKKLVDEPLPEESTNEADLVDDEEDKEEPQVELWR